MAEEFTKEDLELARESVFELCRRANARGGNSSAYQEYNHQLEGHILDVIDRLYLPMLRHPDTPTIAPHDEPDFIAQTHEVTSASEREEWISPRDRLPEKPGLHSYEYVDCWIVFKGRVLMRPFNCEHQVFDDEERDDFFCDPKDVEWWAPFPAPPPMPANPLHPNNKEQTT
ncbi:MAG TPA: hypothetical protein VLZ84_10175 [Asticcacaulis sp.]|nr:hypothetical protein [Asticcacaulis sp.]